MKRTLIVIALATAVTVTATAQTVQDTQRSMATPLSMSCKLKAKDNTKTVNWRTSYGSSDIDTDRRSIYQLSLRWTGKDSATVEIEEIFIASAQKRNFVLEKRSTDVELEPNKTKEIDLVTPSTSENKTKYIALGEKAESGENLKGLVIRAKIDGKIVKVYASDGSWVKLAWNEPFTLTQNK